MDKEYLAEKKYVDSEVNTNVAYGICTTAAATAEKIVNIVNNPNWKLQTGSIIVVKFSYTNTAQNPKLKVGTYGAKPILYGTTAIITANLDYGGYANAYIEYMYNGTYFVFVGWSFDSNSTYTNASLGQIYGTCTTLEAITAKTVAWNGYELSAGGIVAIKFTNAVPAGSTLNINGKGSKAIYHKGAVITDGIIKAGDTATFIYNSQYHLIAVDRDVAISAEKLTEDAGSIDTPVYFEDGKPTECDYTLGNACTKQYTSDITQDNENLITSGAVYAAIEDLNTDIGESITSINSEINSLKDTIPPLQDDVTDLIDEKNIMGSRLTEAETNIINLQTNVSNLQTSVNTNTTDITNLKRQDQTLESRIQENNSAIESLNKDVGDSVADIYSEITSVKNKISPLESNVNILIDEKNIIGSRLTEVENTLGSVKTTAETAETKADNALARNIFTDEEKAKLAGITNPMIIKGRVDTVEDLPTIAEIGWFYFVGLESASSYQEYCYSETGWEYIGVSQEGVDLSNYYTKAQVDSKNHTLEGKIQGNTAAIADLNKDVGDSVAGIYTEITSVKNKISPLESNVNTLIDEKNIIASRLTTAETNIENLQGDVTELQNDVTTLIDEKNIIASRLTEVENTLGSVKTTAEAAETKADNALTQADSNTTNINTLQTDVNALKAVDERIWTNLDTINKTASAAKTKAEEGVAKANDALTATRTNAANISTHETRLDSIDNTLSSHDTRITTAQQKANSVDEKVGATNEVVGQLSTSLQSAYNKINAHANDIAINRTTLGVQCKNLLKNTAVTTTESGITFTVNDDKSITVSGTATSRIIFLVGTAYISQTGNYTYTGTPSGGAASTYSMNYRDRSSVYKTAETGSGMTEQFVGEKTYYAVIDIRSGVTISNLTFYPMLRYTDITDNTYEPYKENIDDRIDKNASDIAVNKSAIAVNKSALGYQRKNLLPYPKSIVKGGITFTCDENGYMTGSNTTSDSRQWTSANAQYSMYLEAGTYYFSSFAETVCTNSDGRAYILTGTQTQVVGVSTRETHVEKMFTLTESTTIYVMAKVYDGKVAFMIREADITDNSYEPYKPSLFERCLLKDTAGSWLGTAQSSSITIDNLSSYTALWINVAGNVSGINFATNLIVPVAYLAKSTSNSVRLAGGIPSSAYIASEGVLAAKHLDGIITAKVSGNTLNLTIGTGTIGSIEVISLM